MMASDYASTIVRAAPPLGLSMSTITRIESEALEQAAAVLTGRRILEFEGPFGVGVPSLQVGDIIEQSIGGTTVTVSARRALTIPTLSATFRIPIRELQGAQDLGLPLSTQAATNAAEAVALAEERLIYFGHEQLGVAGLLNAPGVRTAPLLDWSTPAGAIESVIAAADALDEAGAHGPFSLVLAPTFYNALVRKYEGSDVLAIDHLRRLATGGLFKSSVLTDEAVLVSPDVGPIVCAEDMEVRFLSVDEATVRFLVSESLVLRLDQPSAACVMRSAAPATRRSVDSVRASR